MEQDVLQGCNTIKGMTWDIEYTDEFGQWWRSLLENQQEDTAAVVQLLAEAGPSLRFPYSSAINISP